MKSKETSPLQIWNLCPHNFEVGNILEKKVQATLSHPSFSNKQYLQGV